MPSPNVDIPCRRCKKRRSLQETEETLKFRTCPPCREIERKKKRYKKLSMQTAIAESQSTIGADYDDDDNNNSNDNNNGYINESGSYNSEKLSKTDKQRISEKDRAMAQSVMRILNHEAEQSGLNKEKSLSGRLSSERDIPIDDSLLRQDNGNEPKVSIGPMNGSYEQGQANTMGQVLGNDATSNLINALKNTRKFEASESLRGSKASFCSYCGALRDINDNGRYQLCGNCVNNPWEKSNVYDDLDKFLERITVGRISDLRNIVFIKKFDNNDLIPEFTEHNLKDIMNMLNKNFIELVIKASGFKFAKSSSNLSCKPYPKSIKLLYRCRQDIKTLQKSTVDQEARLNLLAPASNRKLKTEDCHSNFYISYDLFSRSLAIRYNHHTHKTYVEKLYSEQLINLVKSYLEVDPSLDEVFNKLRESTFLSTLGEELRAEIRQLKKATFVRDFAEIQ